MRKPYPDVPQQPNYPELEQRVLATWERERTFQRSIDERPQTNEFVFYDGPPFANGLPHYGHLLTGYVKDIVPRYQTMRGKRVERRFGWDCHGLPAEMEAEKQLGISGRQAITALGIDKFNAHCRQSVLRYTKEWQSYVTRQARWVDFERDYKTMDLSYMESVMWAFSELWRKGLVYEGFRVMPYSWACETPLSNFEIRLDNAYRPRQDPAITVALTLHPRPGDPGPLRLLVWTTTPWTLPANLAVAAGKDIEYALVEHGGSVYVLGAAALAKYEKELGQATRVGTMRGSDLAGRTYEPLFPFFARQPHAFRVLLGDFVDTQEGTGLVHMAPGFGEDDQKLCEQNGIELVCPVDQSGRFTAEVAPYAGQNVFEANKPIIHELKQRGVLLRHETYTHNYPHCWRTDTPLIHRAISSWYVQVSAFKDRMVELNQRIHWIPEHIRDGSFGNWLANARDWSISRNRFWGAPIPIWKSDDPRYPRIDVYGSIAELERDFGVKVTDLHRPFVDALVRKNPDDPTGKSTMRRVEEVLDCWFESGSMPFAQVHYPFENKQWFESHFPADFIVEYIAQTRGWFYTMMVLATALFDRPPFANCICHGVVLDESGNKLSKKLRNYPNPEEVCNTIGADALRWFLVSSPILRGADLQIDREGKAIQEVVRLVLNPLWNAYYFFTLYANADEVTARVRTDQRQALDRYVLAKTRALVESVTQAMDAYDIPGACQQVSLFLEALNNWWIRRSRARFWKSEVDADKRDAYDTLYTVLTTLTRVVAPLLPMLAEEVHRGLTGAGSVHLAAWPKGEELPADPELVAAMDTVRAACSVGLSVREAHDLRIRLPLASATLAGRGVEQLAPFVELIQDELNVKAVRLEQDLTAFGTFVLQVNARAAGPRLGEAMKSVMTASKQGQWQAQPGGTVALAGQVLQPGEFELKLKPREGVACQTLPSNDLALALDVVVTQDLRDEGIARDVVRLVQQARKDAGLHVSDRIELTLELPAGVRAAVHKHQRYLQDQTLATAVAFAPPAATAFRQDGKVEGEPVALGVRKV